jgi:hypothetical protein
MRISLRKLLAALMIAAVLCGCGGSSGSGGAGAVDSQLRDDANWQVIQTADQ